MQIAILLHDGVFDSGLSALLDVFSTATQLSGRRLQVTRLGHGRTVRTGQRAVHQTRRWASCRQRFDHVIVPGTACATLEGLLHMLDRAPARSLVEFLHRAMAGGARLHAACTGTWFLARAGVLDGHAATTSWWYAQAFQRTFPRVRLDAGRSVVRSGAFTTAGAAFSHVDLALALLRDDSPALSRMVSNHLVTEDGVNQALLLLEHGPPADDEVVQRYEALLEANLARSVPLEEASRALAVSPRTLQRRVRASTGSSPQELVQRVRLRRATALLRRTDDSLDHIAEQVGYRSGHTLRLLIRDRLGTTIRQLRRDR